MIGISNHSSKQFFGRHKKQTNRQTTTTTSTKKNDRGILKSTILFDELLLEQDHYRNAQSTVTAMNQERQNFSVA